MYAIIPQQIPQGMRAEVNEKILFTIDSGKDLIPAESIYNCYTGIGPQAIRFRQLQRVRRSEEGV